MLKVFKATYNNRVVVVHAISAAKAIQSAAKIFNVKPNKVSVRSGK